MADGLHITIHDNGINDFLITCRHLVKKFVEDFAFIGSQSMSGGEGHAAYQGRTATFQTVPHLFNGLVHNGVAKDTVFIQDVKANGWEENQNDKAAQENEQCLD